MVITNDKDLFVRASEYHDHGHDHDPNVGRGLEKRRFSGFNFRMMELQGALGLAQLKKLDSIILARQRENKERIMEALARIDQVSFKEIRTGKGILRRLSCFCFPQKRRHMHLRRLWRIRAVPLFTGMKIPGTITKDGSISSKERA